MTYDPKMPKDYRSWVRAAIDDGWVMSQTRHGHLKLTAPDGYATPVPSSSSSRSLFKAFVKRLSSRGITVRHEDR